MDESNFKRKHFESYHEEISMREKMTDKFENEDFGFNSIQNKLTKDQQEEDKPMIVDTND